MEIRHVPRRQVQLHRQTEAPGLAHRGKREEEGPQRGIGRAHRLGHREQAGRRRQEKEVAAAYQWPRRALRIATFNITGIHARLPHLLQWLVEHCRSNRIAWKPCRFHAPAALPALVDATRVAAATVLPRFVEIGPQSRWRLRLVGPGDLVALATRVAGRFVLWPGGGVFQASGPGVVVFPLWLMLVHASSVL